LIDHYENLRSAALGDAPFSAGRMGLAILMHKGMPAWMSARAARVGSEENRPTPATPTRDALSGEFRGRMLDLLCAMMVAHLPA